MRIWINDKGQATKLLACLFKFLRKLCSNGSIVSILNADEQENSILKAFLLKSRFFRRRNLLFDRLILYLIAVQLTVILSKYARKVSYQLILFARERRA